MRRKGKKKNLTESHPNINLHKFLFILFITFIISGLMLSPIFAVDGIEVVGNKIYTKEDILKILNLSDNNSIVKLLITDIKKEAKKYGKIEDIDINYIFPNRLRINVIENPPIGYIQFSNEYVYMDKNGVVIEVSNKSPIKVPILIGLKIEGFKIGEKLNVDDSDIFSNINSLTNVMKKYNLFKDKIMVDASKKDDIHVYINNLDIKFGVLTDIDEKVRKISEAMKHISEKDMGTLDLSTYKDRMIFSPIE